MGTGECSMILKHGNPFYPLRLFPKGNFASRNLESAATLLPLFSTLERSFSPLTDASAGTDAGVGSRRRSVPSNLT